MPRSGSPVCRPNTVSWANRTASLSTRRGVPANAAQRNLHVRIGRSPGPKPRFEDGPVPGNVCVGLLGTGRVQAASLARVHHDKGHAHEIGSVEGKLQG